MKKVLVFCLTFVLLLSMSVTAFAAPGGFVSSPSGNPAPRLISFRFADEDCTAKLVVTPYSQRHTLETAARENMEDSYEEIIAASDVTTLNADLAKLANTLGIAGTALAISDLFDISAEGCTHHDGHHDLTVELEAETLKNFVGLLHQNGDNWELVSNAKVDDDDTLTFTVDSLSPFAIVVDTSTPPKTGDTSLWPIYVSVMAVSIVGLAVVFVVYKNSKKKEN